MVIKMSEFEAYNRQTNEWDVFPLSRLTKIENNRKYKKGRIAVNVENI